MRLQGLAAQLRDPGHALGQAARFGLVGVVNTALALGVLNMLHASGVAVRPASYIGSGLAVVVSFLLNRAWTFRTRRADGPWRQFGRFVAVNVVSVVAFSEAVTALSATMPVPVASLLGVVFSFVANFLLSRLLVFRARP
ncbi:GtrA family protein [Hankyongella ginsenosidimutans]|uniref:GtrA family protein n=1 Tax=Hankyongella ginsenosidimutans TaxID=1763828 RepID=A0A4D7C4P6_9SPHN|nr:GtrA family protein [Hankyongella ginsenosidimutans]QCI80051.1 GtrA family protein [Hankyongella ginsenosidimutans]TXG83132.1 MAG: GtrA family protein [Sphingomonadales bacterium]